MKEIGRKALSAILAGCLMFLPFSTAAYAAEVEGSSEQVIKIMGTYDQTITVKGKPDDSSDNARGSADIDTPVSASSAPDDESADAQQHGRIYLPEGYTDPEFTLFCGSSPQEAVFEQVEDGSY